MTLFVDLLVGRKRTGARWVARDHSHGTELRIDDGADAVGITPDSVQRRNRECTALHLLNSGGRSRQGAQLRAIHNTASTNSRLRSNPEAKIKITLANGRRVSISASIDPAVLARLLPVLDGA